MMSICKAVKRGGKSSLAAAKEPPTHSLSEAGEEMLGLVREANRKKTSEGKLEQWMDSLASVVDPDLPMSSEEVQIPDYSRKVTIRFDDPEVRKKLIKLIDTDVVKIMDKSFMDNLQTKLYESHWEAFEERLKERREWEAVRRRNLALEGIQPLEDECVDNHPMIQVRKAIEKEMEEQKLRAKRPGPVRKTQAWDYEQFVPESEHESEDSCPTEEEEKVEEPDDMEAKRKELESSLSKEERLKDAATVDEYYHKFKYESPLVRKLREAHKVEELYALAEQILEKRIQHPSQTEQTIKDEGVEEEKAT